ncbi:MAG: hypothetical protein F6K56_04590 [Moorea sp. SIO3G5]|nr:hypothetical protein [Moorena sp. SIO3G5]
MPLASCLLPLAFPSWEGLGVGSSCLLPLASCLFTTPYSLLPTPYSLLPAPCSLFPFLYAINYSQILNFFPCHQS